MWGCNDTSIINLDLTDYTFTELKKQIKFHNMNSQGNPVPRLISIQYMKPENDLFLRPIYRHPNDSEPENVEMCDIVREILYEVEKKTKIYGLNHVLVQLYRDGSDNISSHSDKTLDIDRDRPIINVSIGSEREMTIELKENKFIKQKIPLINNTALIFGLKTNEKWKHEIKKNMNGIVGERISLTFRKINTFVLKNNVLNNNDIILIGQGSPYKIIDDITKINITDEMINKELLFNAFSDENKQSVFDWNLTYGKGFLVY
jgi:alkylated DNA repair dioxygenase AlkB